MAASSAGATLAHRQARSFQVRVSVAASTRGRSRADVGHARDGVVTETEGNRMPRVERRAVLGGLAGAAVAGTVLFSSQAHPQSREQPLRLVFPFAAGAPATRWRACWPSTCAPASVFPSLSKTDGRRRSRWRSGGEGAHQPMAAAPSCLRRWHLSRSTNMSMTLSATIRSPISEPLAQVATFAFAVAVGPQVPAKTLKELVDWVRANPGAANYGTPAAGTLPHFLPSPLLAPASSISATSAIAAPPPPSPTLSGAKFRWSSRPPRTCWKCTRRGASGSSLRRTSSVRPCCPMSPPSRRRDTPSKAPPGTLCYAPAKTPPEVVARLNDVIVAALRRPELKERLLALGLYATGTSPDELAKIQKADPELWAPAIKASGFTPAIKASEELGSCDGSQRGWRADWRPPPAPSRPKGHL